MENNNEQKESILKKLGFKNIIIWIVVLLLSFTGAFIIGKTVFSSSDTDPSDTTEIGPLYDSPEFTVNIANSNGRRFFNTQFSLEVSNEKVLKEIEKKLPIMQDKVIVVLSSQSLEELSSLDGKEKIKKQLIDNINPILSNGKIVNIYFNKFVYQ